MGSKRQKPSPLPTSIPTSSPASCRLCGVDGGKVGERVAEFPHLNFGMTWVPAMWPSGLTTVGQVVLTL